MATPLAVSGSDGFDTPIKIAVEVGVAAGVRVVIAADGQMTYH